MAEAALYTILTFQRRPGLWRASISPKAQSATPSHGKTMLGFVTEDDCETEQAAEAAAKLAIRKL